MNKSELIEAIAQQENLPHREASSITNTILETMTRLNSVLGIMDFQKEQLSEKAQDLLDKRNAARAARNWAESDRLRDELNKIGITVLDTPQGTIWKME